MDNVQNQESRQWSSRGGRGSGPSWRRQESEDGDYQGRGGYGRGRGRGNTYNRQYDRHENPYHKDDRGGKNRNPDYVDRARGGFGHPPNQGQSNQGQEYNDRNTNDDSQRSRPRNKQSEDHMRLDSPDRNDRARAKDRLNEDHTRDTSPDRSSNEQYRQGGEKQRSNTQNQSQYDNDFPSYSQGQQGGHNTASGSQASDLQSAQGFQQPGTDNKNSEFGSQWNQGQDRHGQGSRNQRYDRRDNDRNGRNRDYGQQGQYGERGNEFQRYDRRDNDRNGRNRDYGQQGQYGERGNEFQRSDRRDYDRNGRNQDYGQQGQYGEKGNEFQPDRRRRNWEENSDVRLSKALSFLLRHGAEKQGYEFMSGGFLYVDDILYYQKNLQGFTLEDIQRIVQVNDKQRFHMEEDKETGRWKIRANQGHTVQVDNLDLKPLLSKEEAPIVIHGTYMSSWEKIKHTGLSRMGRNHIHFAAGEPGENAVISGMRSSCEVIIFIDIQKALQDGLKFFRSANNVILSAGNEDGVISPTYFEDVLQRFPRQRLDFNKDVKIAKVPIGGESLTQSNKSKKKKKKGKGEKEEGTESKSKKEKMEVDEDAVEGTANLFDNKNMELDDKLVQAPVSNVKKNWDDDGDVYEDTVQDLDDFHDAEDSSDVRIESSEELLFIDDVTFSVSAVDYLESCDVVAVQCSVSEDTITKIVCVVKDKCYTFDLVTTPKIMTDGKLSDFFNFNKDTVKVFHGLNSPTCAIFLEKFNIILDGTNIFDLKVAYDLMNEQGLGDVSELKKTGYKPDLTPSDLDKSEPNSLCQTYLKGYTYLSKVMNGAKDYKKHLFEMVNEDIDKDELKKIKEQRKRGQKEQKKKEQEKKQSKEANKGKGKGKKK